MKKKIKYICGLVLIIVFIISLLLLLVKYSENHIKHKYEKIYFWTEVDDYDNDGEFDALYITRFFKVDEVMKSYYEVEFADGCDINVGPIYGTPSICVQDFKLLDNGEKAILVSAGNEFNNQGQFVVYRKNRFNKYKSIELPVPDSVSERKKYIAGYDIYILDIADGVITVGNDKYGISASFEIEDKTEADNFDLSKGRLIGSTAWRVLTMEQEDGKTRLCLYIGILPESDLNDYSIKVTIEYDDGKWKVVESRVVVVK